MKIVLIGAGSHVFAPTVLLDALDRHRLADVELALVDLNAESAALMAGLGRRIAHDLGLRCTITSTTDRLIALPGADAVLLSASPQGIKRWEMDYAILQRHGLADQSRECGGLGGLTNSLRSVALALAVCRDMERLCPRAVLLDVTNPMPRVVTAINRYSRIRGYGFCNIAMGGDGRYDEAARLTGRPVADLEVVTAGLNHFAWLVALRDRRTGEDLVPLAEDTVRRGTTREFRLMRRWLDEYGAVSMGHPDHHAEYLPPLPEVHYATQPPYHGTPTERAQQQRELAAIGAGDAPWRGAFPHGSWEHPVAVAVALVQGTPLAVPIINLPNAGYLPDLPAGRVVEAPARVVNGVLTGVPVGPLPGRVGALCRQLSDVHEAVAEAAATGDRQRVHAVVDLDLAIPAKAAAHAALDEMLLAHRDMLPQFA